MKTFEVKTEQGTQEMQFVDWECAQAVCDAMQWKLEGELQETVPVFSDDWKKEERSKKQDRFGKPLSGPQKATLCQLCESAFNHMDKYGLIEGIDDSQCKSNRLRDWRHMIVKQVTGRDGLSKCQNGHYRMLEAEFLKLGGKKYENPKAFQTGKQSHRKADTMENRELALHLIKEAMEKHSTAMKEIGEEAAVNEGYVLTVARRQNKETPLKDFDALITLPAGVLEKLLFTVRNRIAAKEGRGDARNRNKGQRKGK